MKDLLLVGIGFIFGLLFFLFPQSQISQLMPTNITVGFVVLCCLFGSLVSFYFAYKLLSDRRPLRYHSSVVYLVFVIPIFGLCMGKFLQKGEYYFLVLALISFIVLWLERRANILVGAQPSYVKNAVKAALTRLNLKFSESGTDIHVASHTSPITVKGRIGGVLMKVWEPAQVPLLKKVTKSIDKEEREKILPLQLLSYQRHVFWGIFLLFVVSFAAANKPWWTYIEIDTSGPLFGLQTPKKYNSNMPYSKSGFRSVGSTSGFSLSSN